MSRFSAPGLQVPILAMKGFATEFIDRMQLALRGDHYVTEAVVEAQRRVLGFLHFVTGEF